MNYRRPIIRTPPKRTYATRRRTSGFPYTLAQRASARKRFIASESGHDVSSEGAFTKSKGKGRAVDEYGLDGLDELFQQTIETNKETLDLLRDTRASEASDSKLDEAIIERVKVSFEEVFPNPGYVQA